MLKFIQVGDKLKEYFNSFLNFIKKYRIFILLFGIYVLITNLCHLTSCTTKLIFGFPCPGCGLSRAFMSLLKLDFKGAIYYNATLFVMPIVAVVIIFRDVGWINKLYKSKVFWIIILVVCIGYYICRMIIFFPNSPLEYYPDNLFSIVIEWIQKIIHNRIIY